MIEVDWGNAEDTILIWTFHNGWTEQDFWDALTLSEKTVDRKTTSTTVHTMLDIQHTSHLPKNMFALGRAALQRGIEKKNDGLIIIINPSELWYRLYDVMAKMMPKNSLKLRFARDANEAYQLVADAEMATNKTVNS